MAAAHSAPLRIGATGYSVREQLLLRSLVRIAGSPLTCSWEFVDDPPYHAIFAVPGADNPAAAGAHHFFVQPPLKSDRIAHLLDTLKIELPRLAATVTAGAAATTAAVASASASAQAHAHGTPAQAEPLDDSAAVARRLLDRGQVPFAWLDGHQRLAIIDPAARTWRASSSTDVADAAPVASTVRTLAARLAQGGLRYVELTADERSTDAGPVRRLEPLLWHVGLLVSPDSVLPQIRRMPRLRLSRWPDFGTVGSDALQLKLSALLISRAYSINGLLLATGGSGERAVAFLNACALCDLFVGEAVEGRPLVSSAPRQFSRVMRMVRGALGMAGA
jgi:hypothetical protein